MTNYPTDFEQGYNYARRRYKALADGCGVQAMLDLAAALGKTTGVSAELARGIAAGIWEAARAESGGGQAAVRNQRGRTKCTGPMLDGMSHSQR